MITVAEINIAPVKSMGLVGLDEVVLDLGGIRDDRRFYLVNGQGRLLTRRQVGKLAQLTAAWDAAEERLSIRFPDGTTLEGSAGVGSPGVDYRLGPPGARPFADGRLDAGIE